MNISYLFRAAGRILVAAVVCGSAAADWDPTDGHKMHFPQLPDEAGWDVNATSPMVLADDWRCSETGWVKDIHFWGSWRDGITGQIQAFELQIYSDIPADQSPTGYSMPGELLWERTVNAFQIRQIDPATMEGWYDPSTGQILPNNHQQYFQYNIFLPQPDWFFQNQGTIYWLSVSAIIPPTAGWQWGWKSTRDHFNDDAVWRLPGTQWVEMYEPTVPIPPITNSYFLQIDPNGNFLGGGGSDAYGDGWYLYPSGWRNIWFYDHPLDTLRHKVIHIDVSVQTLQPGLPSSIVLAVNWTTPPWSTTGNPPPDPRQPPLPGEDEALYIGRATLLDTNFAGGSYSFDFVVPDYNPEWVSIDVQGRNFQIQGLIVHECRGDSISMDLSFVITGGPDTQGDTCDYYKPPYRDYAPNGMPDFDQKQLPWMDPVQRWTHCGPSALANCLWWFDSKFERMPVDPRPFWPGPGNPPKQDTYPMVRSYHALNQWDDHDTNNVRPLVDSLALYCQTNLFGAGTKFSDLVMGASNWITTRGLANHYTIKTFAGDTLQYGHIQTEVRKCEDLILLLGFWEIMPQGLCQRIGGHYVTVAGVCDQQAAICISDPYFDMVEGGFAHGSSLHNDAFYVSGPHGTIHHDRYSVVPNTLCGASWLEVAGYPITAASLQNFAGQNEGAIPSGPYSGGQLLTLIEAVLDISPCCVKRGDVTHDGVVNVADLTYLVNFLFKGGPAPRCVPEADLNGDGIVNVADLTYLVNYLFNAGPAPLPCP